MNGVNSTDSEELFNVVDANDNVIATMPRSDVHRQKLRHRAVHIFLFRSDGRMLIHLRTDTKEEFPSVWTSSASGHVSAGEDYETSAERELFEELGVRASLSLVRKFDACPDTSNEFTKLFSAVSDDEVTIDAGEIADIAWLTTADIEQRLESQPGDFSPAFRLLFAAWSEDRGQSRS